MKYFTNWITPLLIMVGVSFTTFNAHATIYTYDQLNRLTKVTYDSGGYILYAYDPAGNIVRVDNNTSPDINGDGAVNIDDALWVMKILTGQDIPVGENASKWNISNLGKDGQGIGAAIDILRKIADKPVAPPP